MTNLSGSLSYRKDSNSFFINETGTNDGWVPLPISVNAKDLSTSDLKSLASRLGGGSKYQIYVDVDNPNSSDTKTNSGISRLTPFKTLERALLEVARRSFRTPAQEQRLGADGDSFERYTINLAPGEYTIQNTPGGFASISNYPDYQVASNLIQRNRDWIITESLDVTTGIAGETLATLSQDLLSWVVSIASDLSSLTNRRTLLSARELLNPDTNVVCADPLAPPNNYFVGIYTTLSVRQQTVLALTELKARCVDAAKNLGFITDPEITIDPLAAGQIAIYNRITNYADSLIETLQCTFDPRFSSVETYGLPSVFPETGEPPKEFYTMFNHPSSCGVILPRGVSIIGADLRKVIIRPEFVPDYTDPLAEPGSVFKMTGANFFSGFTIKDKRGYNKSHHLLTGFEFSSQDELDVYYNKVRLAFSDKTIYHRAQDAANLLEKNLEWVSNRSVPAIVQANEINYAPVLEGEIFYIIKAIIHDLRLLDKESVYSLGKRFHLTHILPIVDSVARLEAQTFYKASLDAAKLFIRDAINNEANTSEGGVIDESIIVDTEPGARCADVVSAIHSYIEIIKNHIDGLYSGNVDATEFLTSEVDPFIYETSIVIDSNNDGSNISESLNSVVGASPYIFSATIRSEYGMNGIHGDGSKVRGLRSYLAAQFTVISMQRDLSAFVVDQSEVGGYRYKGSKKTDTTPDFRHFGYKASNGAYSQLVSCFCICPAIHYMADSGSEFSISNSTSNFGDVSLYAEGFLSTPYLQDTEADLVGIVKPADIPYIRTPDPAFADQFNLGTIASVTDLGSDTLRVTLSGVAKHLDIYSVDNPTKLNYIYVSSRNPDERRGVVQSVTLNGSNQTELIVDIADSESPWVWAPPEDADATVVGRQLYIKRFVDTRKRADRLYSLILRRDLPLGGKRTPPIHYVIQQNVASGTPQPFTLAEPRSCFYVLSTEPTNLLSDDEEQSYLTQIATVSRDLLGNLEYEIDLDVSSRIDLDYDPSDPLLVGALNKESSASFENTQAFLDLLGVSVNLDVSSTRVVDISAEAIKLDFHKPSIIRSSGQMWEYMGYYNYATALPSVQPKKLGEDLPSETLRKALLLSKAQTLRLGGRIYATGMDEEGNTYSGNSITDLKTGIQETIVRGSSPEVIANIDEIDLDVEFETLTVTGTLTTENLVINSTVTGLPLATTEQAGIAEIATQPEVDTGTDDSRIITPAKLKTFVNSSSVFSDRVEALGSTVAPASETVAGIAEIATQSEVDTGTDDSRIITPAKLFGYLQSPEFTQFILSIVGSTPAAGDNWMINVNTNSPSIVVYSYLISSEGIYVGLSYSASGNAISLLLKLTLTGEFVWFKDIYPTASDTVMPLVYSIIEDTVGNSIILGMQASLPQSIYFVRIDYEGNILPNGTEITHTGGQNVRLNYFGDSFVIGSEMFFIRSALDNGSPAEQCVFINKLPLALNNNVTEQTIFAWEADVNSYLLKTDSHLYMIASNRLSGFNKIYAIKIDPTNDSIVSSSEYAAVHNGGAVHQVKVLSTCFANGLIHILVEAYQSPEAALSIGIVVIDPSTGALVKSIFTGAAGLSYRVPNLQVDSFGNYYFALLLNNQDILCKVNPETLIMQTRVVNQGINITALISDDSLLIASRPSHFYSFPTSFDKNIDVGNIYSTPGINLDIYAGYIGFGGPTPYTKTNTTGTFYTASNFTLSPSNFVTITNHNTIEYTY